MISIQINGETRQLQDGLSLQDLLREIGFASQALAVALNSEIIPRSHLDGIRLRENDRVEIIRAVGGG